MDIDLLTIPKADCLMGMIDDAERIVVCAHRSPDGDALGSSLGWAGYLRSQGKDPLVCVPDMFPDFLQWLPGAQSIVRYDKHPDIVTQAMAEADLIFCLDFSQEDRLGDMALALSQSKADRIVIDHHPSPTIPTKMLISQPKLSSASEVVFRVIWQLGGFGHLTRQDAVCLYCGMMTDTGGFTYNSAAPNSSSSSPSCSPRASTRTRSTATCITTSPRDACGSRATCSTRNSKSSPSTMQPISPLPVRTCAVSITRRAMPRDSSTCPSR